MARKFLRQTFIALRSRRQAYRIAADFLYEEPIDVDTIACRSCRQPMRVEAVNAAGNIRCPTCGVWNRAPAHLRSRRISESREAGEGGVYAGWALTMEQARRRQRIAILLIVLFFVSLIALLIAEAYTRANPGFAP